MPPLRTPSTLGLFLCAVGLHDWRTECYYAQRALCDVPEPFLVDRCARCRETREASKE